MRRNPTPLLRKAQRTAEQWLARYGSRGAWDRTFRLTDSGNKRKERLGWVIIRYLDREMTKAAAATKTAPPPPKRRPKRVVVTARMFDELVDTYGLSDALYCRGFIVDSGECLDLGCDDHRIICGVYSSPGDAEDKFGSRWGAMANLCRKFNMIRWMPESGYAEVFVEPTRDQVRTLSDLAAAGKLKEIEAHGRGWGLREFEYEGVEVKVSR